MATDPLPLGQQGASLSDILTVARNLVQGVNGLIQTYLNVQGALNVAQITASTLVKPKGGRVATVYVNIPAASEPYGWIYDTNLLTSTANRVYAIPAAQGVYVVNIPCAYGIVVQPGAGQELTVSYS